LIERKTVSSQRKQVRLKKIIVKEADLVIKMTERKTAERGEERREIEKWSLKGEIRRERKRA